MWLYFLAVRIAALFGHRKAKMLVRGQGQTLKVLKQTVKSTDKTIWFHAASVGEFEQGRPLLERIHTTHPEYKIVVTFFSPSGYNHYKDYPLAKVVYLPFATHYKARKFLSIVHPTYAFLIKYDYWPAYLQELKKRKIQTYLVSALFRENQFFFSSLGGGYRNLLKCFTQLFVQDETSKNLLRQYGIHNVSVIGDTRFDRVVQICNAHEPLPIAQAFVKDASQVIVAGSTWLKDEVLLARYVEEHPTVKLILVPHEVGVDRIESIFQLFEGRLAIYSQTTPENVGFARVLLVDVIGQLSKMYGYGHVAYVGGGFGAGIHNIIEAAVYGVPILFGPKYTPFREACDLVRIGGGFTVKNYRSFAKQMDNALAHHEAIGKITHDYVVSEQGATEKIYQYLYADDTTQHS